MSLKASSDVFGKWDGFRIEQVIINLLTNSLKYGAGRPVEIYVGSQDMDTAIISFRDHGIGVAKEDHHRIFKRFERAVSGMNYSGLGIGLYISQQIVELHQGRIWVESEKDSGSKFIVELPTH